jgi:hypothetical protein
VPALFADGSAHLTTDSDDLSELHDFAQRLGIPRAGFQAKTIPHYDLERTTWELAQTLGATLVTSRELIKLCHPRYRAKK